MLSKLKAIRARFIFLIISGLLLTPLAGLVTALLFGLVTPAELQADRTLVIMAIFVGIMAGWAYIHFSIYFSPLSN